MTSFPVLLLAAVTWSVLQCTCTLPAPLLTSYVPSSPNPVLEGVLDEVFQRAVPDRRRSPGPLLRSRASPDKGLLKLSHRFPGRTEPPSSLLSALRALPHPGRKHVLQAILLELLVREHSGRVPPPSLLPGRRWKVPDGGLCLHGCRRRQGQEKKAGLQIRSSDHSSTYPPSLYLLGGAVGR